VISQLACTVALLRGVEFTENNIFVQNAMTVSSLY
jgi:hypothetical protein